MLTNRRLAPIDHRCFAQSPVSKFSPARVMEPREAAAKPKESSGSFLVAA